MKEITPPILLEDERFHMGHIGRAFAKWIPYLGWGSAAVLAVWLLLYGTSRVQWAGVFLALFVLDRVLYAGRADKTLSELSSRGRGNIAEFLTPDAAQVLFNAHAASSKGKIFALQSLMQLSKNHKAQKIFSKLGIPAGELRRKLKNLPQTGGQEHWGQTENLARLALMHALRYGSREVGAVDILGALAESHSQTISQALAEFSLKPEILKLAAALAGAKKQVGPRKGIPLPPIPARR